LFDCRRDRGSQKAALASPRNCRCEDRDRRNCRESEEHPHASGQSHSNSQQEREPGREEKLRAAARIVAPRDQDRLGDALAGCPQRLRAVFFVAEDN
jgi:hypothetical protein